MFEQSEFRSDHDPAIAGTAVAPARPKPPLGKRIRAWTIVSFLFLVLLGTTAGGILYARHISRSGRWDDLPIVMELLLPLGFVVWFFIRHRTRTGKWSESREQQLQRRAEFKARRTPARLRARSLGSNVLTWAGYTAFESSCPSWQRAGAWTVLVGYALLQLAFVAVAVIAIGASFADDDTVLQRLLFCGLGLLFLFVAGKNALLLLRRKQAGSLRITREEHAELKTHRDAWRLRESQKPLRSKVVTIVFAVATEAYLWMRVTVFHAHHRHESWITPLFSLPACTWVIWVQLRSPKQAPTQDTADTPTA